LQVVPKLEVFLKKLLLGSVDYLNRLGPGIISRVEIAVAVAVVVVVAGAEEDAEVELAVTLLRQYCTDHQL
jgi:hypothetical protein